MTAVATPASATKGTIRIAEPVPLADIHIRDGFNMRSTFDKAALVAMGESMRTVGQLEDIILTERWLDSKGQPSTLPPGTGGSKRDGWWLVAGERRFRAAGIIGWKTLRASEVPPANAVKAHAHENVGRVQLSHADRVRYIVTQRAAGVDNKELAELFMVNQSTIRNDNLIGTKLDPEVFREWSRFPNAVGIALRLYALPPEAQRKAFAEWKKGRTALDGSPLAKRTRGKGKKGAPPDGRRTFANAAEAVGTMVDLAKAAEGAKGKDALDKEVIAFIAGAEWAIAYMKGTKGIPRDLMSEVKAAAEAAPKADKRQLALPGTDGKDGKAAKRGGK